MLKIATPGTLEEGVGVGHRMHNVFLLFKYFLSDKEYFYSCLIVQNVFQIGRKKAFKRASKNSYFDVLSATAFSGKCTFPLGEYQANAIYTHTHEQSFK